MVLVVQEGVEEVNAPVQEHRQGFHRDWQCGAAQPWKDRKPVQHDTQVESREDVDHICDAHVIIFKFAFEEPQLLTQIPIRGQRNFGRADTIVVVTKRNILQEIHTLVPHERGGNEHRSAW